MNFLRGFLGFAAATSVLAVWGLSIALAASGRSAAVSWQAQDDVGVYTDAQAERGGVLYRENCVECHGNRLDDGIARPLVGPQFIGSWSQPDRTLDDLLYILRTTMPHGEEGTLSQQEYVDVIAYILERNGYPAGAQALTPDRSHLGEIRIEAREPAAASDNAPPPFIRGEEGLIPLGYGPEHGELVSAAENVSDWLYHTHDYSGQRYVNLAQINTTNAAGLRPACVFQMGDRGTFQTGPIVYGGVMYVTTPHVTAALDATSCRPLWRHRWEPKDRQVWLNNRGVAVKDGYVVRGTADGYLFALDSENGALLWARQIADPSVGETFTMAPLIYDDLVLIGPAGSENAISGWVGAFRLENGEEVWRFLTVPGASRSGGETWGNPEGIVLGGGAIWTPLSLDVERGELYVPVTNPAPDFPAAMRPGANLYTNSLVALDVRTGELRWYEQLVPNDAHDWDLTQVSPLYRTRVGDTERDLVATAGKDGMLRVVDRDSHERIYETPVTTIENADVPLSKDEGVHVCPGALGGVEWNGPAYHPGANVLVTPAVDWCSTYRLADEVRFVQGQLYMGGMSPMDREKQGWLTAVDASDGTVRWKYRSSLPMVAAVTTTAGGLVLTGELTGDFLVLDVSSGEELYRFDTGGPIGAGIVTYEIEGKQYIGVTSGLPSPFWYAGNPGSPSILIFALP